MHSGARCLDDSCDLRCEVLLPVYYPAQPGWDPSAHPEPGLFNHSYLKAVIGSIPAARCAGK